MDSLIPRRTESTLITQYGNLRSVKDLITEKEVYQSKSTISRADAEFYRYVTSQELPVPYSEILASGPMTEYSYSLKYAYDNWNVQGALVSLQISSLSTTRVGTESRTAQSLSIEIILAKDYPPAVVKSIAQQVMDTHNGWSIGIPTIDAMQAVIAPLPLSLKRPIDLTWNTLTYSTLIENPHAITFKTDGTRMLLALSNVGTFFVTQRFDVIPISVTHRSKDLILIDGELVKDSYWAFDILYSGRSLVSLPYSERHSILSSILPEPIVSSATLPIVQDPLKPIPPYKGSISVHLVPIYIPVSAQAFFRAIEKALDSPVPNDGIILTPLQREYGATSYKWKPTNLLTVDFFIIREKGKILLNTFKDRELHPHPELEAIVPQEMIGTIGEFSYQGDNKWSFVRQRFDKANPNDEGVYRSIMALHLDPITLPDITGKTLALAHKYFSRMKEQVYNYLAGNGITDIGTIDPEVLHINSWTENNLNVTVISERPEKILEYLRASNDVDTVTTDTGPVYYSEGDCWKITVYPITVRDYIYSVGDQVQALVLDKIPEDLECVIDSTVQDQGYIAMIAPSDILLPVLTEFRSLGWTSETDMVLDRERLMSPEGVALSKSMRLVVLRKYEAKSMAIRNLYTPLGYGSTQVINSPWGTVTRVGTPFSLTQKDGVVSMIHALLQASSTSYRNMDKIGKTVEANRVKRLGISTLSTIPVYLIFQNTWNMVSPSPTGDITVYPALNPSIPRKPGYVIMQNLEHWEPLAKLSIIGELQYVW